MRKIGLSLEIPAAHLEDISPLVDLHFIIASEVKKNLSYRRFYADMESDGKVIILDNGMYEEGHPMKGEELLDIALEIKATDVFAPDQHPDRLQTLKLSEEFISLKYTKGAPFNVGLIPQGQDPSDIFRCYTTMMQFPFQGPIGLSFLDNRPLFLKLYGSMLNKERWYHMLGLYNIREIKDWPSFEYMTMDTIKPIKAAKFNLKIEDNCRGLGKWSSYWKLNSHELQLAYRNIAKLHQQLTRGGDTK